MRSRQSRWTQSAARWPVCGVQVCRRLFFSASLAQIVPYGRPPLVLRLVSIINTLWTCSILETFIDRIIDSPGRLSYRTGPKVRAMVVTRAVRARPR